MVKAKNTAQSFLSQVVEELVKVSDREGRRPQQPTPLTGSPICREAPTPPARPRSTIAGCRSRPGSTGTRPPQCSPRARPTCAPRRHRTGNARPSRALSSSYSFSSSLSLCLWVPSAYPQTGRLTSAFFDRDATARELCAHLLSVSSSEVAKREKKLARRTLSAPAQRPRAATCRRSSTGARPARKPRRSGRFRRLGRATVPGRASAGQPLRPRDRSGVCLRHGLRSARLRGLPQAAGSASRLRSRMLMFTKNWSA